ncbi:MAG TPA: acyl-CoA dehydrogenase [Myxococcales bacterium]|nr:acyl-CoA dehydrogenase [Deltaproteobacteria bacterium]HAA58666.1 acyl-CoA dehydrogenase [Myxococcales bacterium]|tara:strand:- start:3410 stop:5284 length:1875 start_codon:yes stop_codon:yes gene_type:complete
MAEYLIDQRDLEFVVFEQFGFDALLKSEKYSDFSEDILRDTITQAVKFAGEVLAPTNDEADKFGCRLVDGKVELPPSFQKAYNAYCENGWAAPGQSAELGGMGLPLILAIIAQEVGIAASPSFMFFPGLTVGAAHLVEAFGQETLRDLVVPKMYTGEWTGTMCLTEPQAGTAVGDLKTVAVPLAEGEESTAPFEGLQEYKITGNKIFISAGDHELTDNIMHLVLARVEGDPVGIKGISLFLVPKYRFDKDGKILGSNDVACTAVEHKMGIHASPTCSLSFGDEGECRGFLIGEQRRGIHCMFQMMNEARIACGVQGVSLGNVAFQRALSYAKERVQGTKITERDPNAERVTILQHPDVRRNLMICKAYGEGIRALLYQAAFHADFAENHSDEALRTKYHDRLELLTPICKAYASDKGFKMTELAIQVHGGYGYIQEYGVEQCMRDVKIASIYEGTNGIQALDLLGRKMRLKEGGLFMAWLQDTNEFIEENAEHTALKKEFKLVEEAKNALAEVSFHFMMSGKEDPERAMMGATPFLEMFGHVEVSRLLLEQAVLADQKLQALFTEKNVAEADRAAFIKESVDARFYDGKVKTAQFFAHHILPEVYSLASGIKADDRSALDIDFM